MVLVPVAGDTGFALTVNTRKRRLTFDAHHAAGLPDDKQNEFDERCEQGIAQPAFEIHGTHVIKPLFPKQPI
jgi:hypothetical protein